MDDQFIAKTTSESGSTTDRSRSLGAQHLKVTDANEHGIVIESDRPFETGATVALGLHVNSSSRRNSRFISAETVVVASQPRCSESGRVVHEVTLIFCDISPQDQMLLLNLSEKKALRKISTDSNSNASFGPAPVSKHGFSLN